MSYHDERSDQHWQLTNQGGMATSTSFPTRVPVSTPYAPPAGQGVFQAGDGMVSCGALGSLSPKRFLLKPFGTGTAGSTFQMNVYEWTGTTGSFFNFSGSNLVPLAIPTLLATYSITLGNNAGVPGTDMGQQYLFAGTITQSYGPTFINANAMTAGDWFIMSPGNTASGMIVQRTLGGRSLEVTFQLGTATGANCLYKKM